VVLVPVREKGEVWGKRKFELPVPRIYDEPLSGSLVSEHVHSRADSLICAEGFYILCDADALHVKNREERVLVVAYFQRAK